MYEWWRFQRYLICLKIMKIRISIEKYCYYSLTWFWRQIYRQAMTWVENSGQSSFSCQLPEAVPPLPGCSLRALLSVQLVYEVLRSRCPFRIMRPNRIKLSKLKTSYFCNQRFKNMIFQVRERWRFQRYVICLKKLKIK